MVNRLIFPLQKQPIPVQLTVHINNLIVSYSKEVIINDFKDSLNGETPNITKVSDLIDYYGVEDCRDFFQLVYGWKFKEVI